MVYLDYNATTPVLAEVFEAMRPYFCSDWGNPSSSYRFGAKLKRSLENAREQVAALANTDPSAVLFTSCATESNNAAIRAALELAPKKRHVVTSAAEHSSVLNFCKHLESAGYSVTYLEIRQDGHVSLQELEGSITDQTALVSLMWANNETGVIHPVGEIGSICENKGVLFHCDAVQAAGKVSMDIPACAVDFLTLSAHKLFGPKGCGALIAIPRLLHNPVLFGGHQEEDRRGGTENVASIIGFGKAAELASSHLSDWSTKCRQLRDSLEGQIVGQIPGAWVNGDPKSRLPNTTNIGFPGINSDAMVGLLDSLGVCVSSGSACLSSSISPSHVIFAMTGSHEKARESLRFSTSHLNSQEEIDLAVAAVKRATASFGR